MWHPARSVSPWLEFSLLCPRRFATVWAHVSPLLQRFCFPLPSFRQDSLQLWWRSNLMGLTHGHEIDLLCSAHFAPPSSARFLVLELLIDSRLRSLQWQLSFKALFPFASQLSEKSVAFGADAEQMHVWGFEGSLCRKEEQPSAHSCSCQPSLLWHGIALVVQPVSLPFGHKWFSTQQVCFGRCQQLPFGEDHNTFRFWAAVGKEK